LVVIPAWLAVIFTSKRSIICSIFIVWQFNDHYPMQSPDQTKSDTRQSCAFGEYGLVFE
jgi:hypothetical protein